jgi:hypothetical protein
VIPHAPVLQVACECIPAGHALSHAPQFAISPLTSMHVEPHILCVPVQPPVSRSGGTSAPSVGGTSPSVARASPSASTIASVSTTSMKAASPP